ncbi:hypothetical protein LXL04_013099 [Taraxacum kok-saghyz]
MNFMQKSTAATSRDRAHQIITGNRTEYQRPCSSFGMAETTSTSSYNGGGKGNSTAPGCMISYYRTDSSQKLSSDEEEDMANCLIMLAQSHSVSPAKEDKSDRHSQKTEKLKNRTLTEMAAATAGAKSDFHNYECKTCNRAFPSFQALGGHRASHKKPKLNVEDRKSGSIKMECSTVDQPEVVVEYEESKIITNNTKSPPPPGFIQTGHKNMKGKVHECSICGLEYLSGQALGGHMRRHRPPPPSNSQIANHSPNKSPMLSLDLNLPAPEFVDDVHSNFQYTASSPKQRLVFSAAAMILRLNVKAHRLTFLI